MNEKEMIEEMAKDLSQTVVQDYGGVYFLETAKALYKQGYRKIPDGSVVFQQKDLTKLQNAITQSCNSRIDVDAVNYLTNTVESLKNKLKELEQQRDRQAYIAEELIQEKHRWTEQARKETAKEIFNELDKKKFVSMDMRDNVEYIIFMKDII